MIYGSEHPDSFLDLEDTVTRTTQALAARANDFDCIVACGMSGVVVAAPVAIQLGKPLIIVRKENDANAHHSGGTIIGRSQLISARYLILDDFVSLGTTCNYVQAVIRAEFLYAPTPPRYTGTWQYRDDAMHR
jgi:adenine/guanine phosphoribosyltransferase-like PRPP-binding protein